LHSINNLNYKLNTKVRIIAVIKF